MRARHWLRGQKNTVKVCSQSGDSWHTECKKSWRQSIAMLWAGRQYALLRSVCALRYGYALVVHL